MIASFCNHGSLRASSSIWASEASRERTWISSCVPLAQLLFKISPKWRVWSQATITAEKKKNTHTHPHSQKKNKKKTWKALHLLPLRSFGKWHCTFMDPTAQRNITFASLKKRLPFLSSLFSADRAKGDWGERKNGCNGCRLRREKGRREACFSLSPSVSACLFFIFVFIERRSRNFCGGRTEGGHAWLRPKLPVLLCVPREVQSCPRSFNL